MQKFVDLSELNEEQKLTVLQGYLKDLAKLFGEQAKKVKGAEDLGHMSEVLESSENEVLRLEQWATIIIRGSIGRHMAEQMSQSMRMQQEAMNKPTVEMDGYDVGKLFDHISAAKAQTKKTLELMKRGNKTAGEKRCLEMLFAFETIDNILVRIAGVRP
jgi:hypothetical protein